MNSNVLEYSLSKALFHEDKIKLLKLHKPIIPTTIQIDPEAWCNDNCSFCSYRKEDGYNNEMLKLIDGKPNTENKAIGKPSLESRIPDDILLSIPQQMVDVGIKAAEVTGGGEPTLHPKILEFLTLLGEAKRDIGLVTNGSKLTPKLIECVKKYVTWIRISMDASNPEIHKKIHRTPNLAFEKRLDNIKLILDGKREDLIVGISFIITPENIDDIESAARLFASLGVNHIRFSWMYDKQGTAGLTKKQIKEIDELIPKLQQELDRNDFKIFNEKNRIQLYTQSNDFDTCHFQRFVVAIGADSGLYPCCIQKYNPDYQYANLKNNTLDEIVTSMNVDAFMTDLDPIDCRPCWLSPRNASIDGAVKDPNYKPIPKPNHENFI